MADLRDRLGGLPSPAESAYVWNDIWHLEAHHSTALEGNTLVLREVAALLDQGKAVGAKPLKEYMEVKGYGDAAHWVYDQALASDRVAPDRSLITQTELRSIHFEVMNPVWLVAPHPDAIDAESPGNFRQHDLHPFGAGMQPPSWPLVPAALEEWLRLANAMRDDSEVPLPERAAEVHARFEQVHPFIDGNGRTGRLALNLVLVRMGWPPVIVLKQHRPAYLAAMQRADSGDFGALGELLGRAMLDNLNRFILPSVAGPARLLPLNALSDQDLGISALRAAARRGRLAAEQRSDGTWLSTKRAVEEYKASRRRRRPQ